MHHAWVFVSAPRTVEAGLRRDRRTAGAGRGGPDHVVCAHDRRDHQGPPDDGQHGEPGGDGRGAGGAGAVAAEGRRLAVPPRALRRHLPPAPRHRPAHLLPALPQGAPSQRHPDARMHDTALPPLFQHPDTVRPLQGPHQQDWSRAPATRGCWLLWLLPAPFLPPSHVRALCIHMHMHFHRVIAILLQHPCERPARHTTMHARMTLHPRHMHAHART